MQSDGKVWSPALKAFAATAADALVAPVFSGDPNHLGIGWASFPGAPQPTASGQYVAVLHDSTGKPVGQPMPIDPKPTIVIMSSGVVNLGG